MNGDGFPAWHHVKVKNSTIAVTIVVNVCTIPNSYSPDNEDICYSKEDDKVWADIDIDKGGDDIAPMNTIILDAVENFCKTKTVEMAKYPLEVEELPKHLPSPNVTLQKKALVKGNPQLHQDKRKQIFEEPPHIEMDSFFSGDIVMNFRGEQGWKRKKTLIRSILTTSREPLSMKERR